MGHREEHMMRGHVTGDTTLLKEALRWFAESHDLFAAAGRQRFAYGDMAVCHLDLGDDQKSLELLEELLPEYAEAGGCMATKLRSQI